MDEKDVLEEAPEATKMFVDLETFDQFNQKFVENVRKDFGLPEKK